MVFRYLRTMVLRAGDSGDLKPCEAPNRCYTQALLRSKGTYGKEMTPTLYAREASAASTAPFKRRLWKLTRSGPQPVGNLQERHFLSNGTGSVNTTSLERSRG